MLALQARHGPDAIIHPDGTGHHQLGPGIHSFRDGQEVRVKQARASPHHQLYRADSLTSKLSDETCEYKASPASTGLWPMVLALGCRLRRLPL